MSVRLTTRFHGTAIETLTSSVDGITAPDVTHDKFNTVGTFSATTTIPVTEVFSDTVALVAAAKTLDFTALAGVNGTIDATGLKLQFFLFRNPTGNSAITIKDGASNGYNLFGDASGQVTIPAGGLCQFFGADLLQDVAAADAEIDITGTGTESFDVLLVFG